jgi:ribonuclease HI
MLKSFDKRRRPKRKRYTSKRVYKVETAINDNLRHVDIFVASKCIGNPGRAGYGILLKYKEHKQPISGGYKKTTNSRIEIFAVIEGLKALKERCHLTIYTGTKQLADTLNSDWAKNRKDIHWIKKGRKFPQDVVLLEQLLNLSDQHEVEFKWGKGYPENEKCTVLAYEAARRNNLPSDMGYKQDISY